MGRGDCGIDDEVVGSSPDSKWSKMGPSPGPSPPGPSPPGPPTPGCKDDEDSSYCTYTKQQGYCTLLADKCKKTCGCCVANPPAYCSGPSGYVEGADQAVRAAVDHVVV